MMKKKKMVVMVMERMKKEEAVGRATGEQNRANHFWSNWIERSKAESGRLFPNRVTFGGD
jgi:hypothetical protein